MYDNMQEKYNSSVFQILKIWKAVSNIDFNSIIRKKNTRHTGILGLWTQELDAGFWTLDSGL